MKNNKFSFKYLGLGFLAIIAYFVSSNIIMSYLGSIKESYRYFLVYLIACIMFVLIFKKDLITDFKDFKKNYKKYLPISFNYWLKGFFIMITSNIILNYYLKLNQSTNEAANIALLKNSLFLHTITIIFIAPLIEEIVFRLSFNKMTNNKHLYAYITGIIFGFVHVITSLTSPIYLLLLIPYSSMGVALGYAYKENKNIFSSLAMHMLHNTLTVTIIIIGIIGGVI